MPDKQLDLWEKCLEVVKIAKSSQKTYASTALDLASGVRNMVLDALHEGSDSAVIYFQRAKSGNGYELAIYYDFKEGDDPKNSEENK